VPDEYYEEVLPRLVRALVAAEAPVVLHVCSEWAAGWPLLSSRWEAVLRAAGAVRVSYHLGQPWPATREGWGSHSENHTDATNRDLLETFHHMANADVLLTSASGFSKAAARYSVGLVLQLSGAQEGTCKNTAPGIGCLHRLPSPPRCTASTDERLERLVSDAAHVDFQCCSGQWRNATPTARHCLRACLAAGDDIRSHLPTASRRRHAEGQPPDDRMPLWSPAHASWVWCRGIKSRNQLIRRFQEASVRVPWEGSVTRAAKALLERKEALRARIDARAAPAAPAAGWASLWELISHPLLVRPGGASGLREQIAGCCAVK